MRSRHCFARRAVESFRLNCREAGEFADVRTAQMKCFNLPLLSWGGGEGGGGEGGGGGGGGGRGGGGGGGGYAPHRCIIPRVLESSSQKSRPGSVVQRV